MINILMLITIWMGPIPEAVPEATLDDVVAAINTTNAKIDQAVIYILTELIQHGMSLNQIVNQGLTISMIEENTHNLETLVNDQIFLVQGFKDQMETLMIVVGMSTSIMVGLFIWRMLVLAKNQRNIW